MPGKHLDLDLDNNLGGENPSDVYIASQKATKTYVDGEINTVNEKIDSIQVVDELSELQDVTLTSPSNGQGLIYDSASGKWVNGNVASGTAWGDITGTLANQTDLSNALSGKANASHTHTKSEITDLAIPSKVSELSNDAGYITNASLSEFATLEDIPTNVSELNNDSGFITNAALPTALSDLTDDLGSSPTHTHSQYLTEHQDISGKADLSELATVATSGQYSDLIGTPSNVSIFNNDAGYLTSSDISAMLEYKGNKATVEDLPATGNKKGDVWTVTATGAEYVWTGSAWEYLGQILDLSGYVVNSRTINGKALTSDITLNHSDVGALSSSTFIPTISDTYNASSTNGMSGKAVASAISTKQDSNTAVTHTASTSVGNNKTPVYIASDGKATALDYTIEKSVPSDAKFTDTTYSTFVKSGSGAAEGLVPAPSTTAGSTKYLREDGTWSKPEGATYYAGAGLSMSGTTLNHSNSVTSGTVGTNAATSGSTLAVPYVTYDAQGHVTATGTHTHTVTGFLTEHQDISGKANTSELADVAFSGAYSDLSGTPTIPSTYSDVGAASAGHTHSNYVVNTTKVAGKALTSDVTITYSDVNAASNAHTHTYGDVGAASAGHTHSDYVPTTRKVAGKVLSSDITLTYSDVSAASSGHSHTYSDVGAASSGHTHTYTQVGAASAAHTHSYTYSDVGAASEGHTHSYSDVGAASASHTHNAYVATSRKVAGHALTADVTISSTDISDLNTTISTAISGKANSTETYTKSEIDGKLTGAMHFKGTKANAAALPSTGNTTGDMWNVTDTGANYAWDGTAWDKLSENIDLSGVVPNTRTVNGKALSSDITLSYSDVGALSSATAIPSTYSDVNAASASHTHSGYVPTSRTINSKALTSNITLTYSDVGALSANTSIPTTYSDINAASESHTHSNYVPTTRKVAGKALSSDISLTYSDVNAASSSHTHSYTDVGAASSSHTHSGYVSTSRKINSKALTSDITLTYSDVSAASSGHTHTYGDVGAASASHTHTYSDVGALSANTFIPSTYTDVSAASANHTHTYSDVGAASAGHTHTYSQVGAASASHTHTYSDVGALSAGTTIPQVTDTYSSTSTKAMSGKAVASAVAGVTYTSIGAASSAHTHTYSDVGAASANHTHTYSQVGAASASHAHSGYQSTSTAVTHTASTSVGNSTTPVYVASNGAATALSYTIAKSVPSDAKFSDTTYTAGTGLSLSGTTINHDSSITAGTVGTSTASSGYSLTVPYVTYNASGHITATGTRTHSVTIKQDGITSVNGVINRFCTCTAAATTAAKTASITTGTFSLEAGARVTVKFSNVNTAAYPTLNINSTGAKNIYFNGTQITSTGVNILAGVTDFVYDGTQWHVVGSAYNQSTVTVGQLAG